MYDVAIIGCGVIGAATAYALSRYENKVVILEAENDVADCTTKANSAILHAGYDPAPGTKMARLNVRGVELAKEICAKLDVPYKQCGSLVLALSESELPHLQHLYENGTANGVPDMKILTKEETLAMEPNLSENVCGALWAPSAAIVSPWEYALAMTEVAVRNGVELRRSCRVEDAEAMADGGYRLTTTQGTVEARYVINAAGIWAEKVHCMVEPASFHITPTRGEYYLLDKSEGTRVSHVIFQCPNALGKGVLVAPTVHGNLLVGPTAIDVDDKEATATTAAGLNEVREKSGLAVKDLPMRQTITSFAGLRAHEPRHDFFIGEIAPGFVDCAAIESPGLSSAPAVGAMVADIVKNSLHLRDDPTFDPTRKGILDPKTLPFEERAALIKENPAYGQIICRCESVTEGEIIDAIHRVPGARSLDGVKRRTRAGMGRCQAGFCSPRVMEILARELGVPQSEITKAGGKSKIIVGTNKDTF